jgi:hypothetical protein
MKPNKSCHVLERKIEVFNNEGDIFPSSSKTTYTVPTGLNLVWIG